MISSEVVLAHEGKTYTVHLEWPWLRESTQFNDGTFSEYIYRLENIWVDGNFSCDCNRLDFIAAEYDDVPPMDNRDCGESVELISIGICGVSEEEAELINQEVKSLMDEASAALWRGDAYGFDWRIRRVEEIIDFPMRRAIADE